MKRIIFFVITLVSACCAVAQQATPRWVNETPKAGNKTYVYDIGKDVAYSRQEAYNRALTRVFQNTANRIGQPFDSGKLKAALESGTPLDVISYTYNIPINKVCEYETRLSDGSYCVYVLCQVAVAGNIQPKWETFSKCKDDGEGGNFTALLKSMFVPGLGQMGKGHVAEGALTLVGEIVLIGGAVGCYYIAQDRLNVMRDPMVNYEDFISARQTYNTCRTTNYILWSTAAGLYVFNLIRAVSANKRYREVAFEPALIPTETGLTPGVSFTLNF